MELKWIFVCRFALNKLQLLTYLLTHFNKNIHHHPNISSVQTARSRSLQCINLSSTCILFIYLFIYLL